MTGTPRIQLNTSPTEYATYSSGTGTNTLTFTYTVASGDSSTRLNYASTTALCFKRWYDHERRRRRDADAAGAHGNGEPPLHQQQPYRRRRNDGQFPQFHERARGQAQFTLQVNGSGFSTGTTGSMVTWTPAGGTPVKLARTSTQTTGRLQVLVPATLMADETASGGVTIAVTTGGSTTFTVTDADSLTTTVQSFMPLAGTVYNRDRRDGYG